MATKFIDGVGLVTVSSRKSKEEVDLTMDYYENIAPRYQELGGFAAGFNDTESIIYRWWENAHKTEDEEKDTWFKEQVSQWGKMVGYTDSQALLKFYDDLEKIRPLNAEEQADIEANHVTMKNFEADMYDAYDNDNGDISDVQKKYGYDEEELGVMKGLWEFGKLAATNPRYMLGSLAGMVIKDPELLLLGFLRIPSLAGQGAARSAQMLQATRLAQQAIKIQPKYVQGLSRAIQSNRGRAVVGRAAEGATYAGTYEALHDLTFNGHIKKENIERGLALGALLGSAFGAVTKSTGAHSWLLSKQGSINAEKKLSNFKQHGEELKYREYKKPDGTKGEALGWEAGWQKRMQDVQNRINNGWKWNKETKVWEAPVKPEEAKPVDALGLETKNIDFRVVPNKAKLPEGLTHGARYKLWRDRAVQVWKRGEETVGDAGIRIDGFINSRKSKLLLERDKDGVAKYTNEEASALAAKEVAQRLEKLNPEFIKAESKGIPKNQRPKNPNNKDWGKRREEVLGKENLTEVRPRSSFKDLFRPRNEELPLPTGKQLAKAGAIGGAAGYYILEDDKTLGGILGMTGAVLARRQLRGINRSKAMMKLKLYSTMAKSESIKHVLQAETGKTLNVLAQVLKGEHPTISNIEFLTYLEHWSRDRVVKGKNVYDSHGANARSKLPQDVQNALDAYRKLMETFRKAAIEAGVLKSDQFIADYVTHIYRLGKKPLTESEIAAFQKRLKQRGSDFTNFSSFGKQRKIVEDIIDIAKRENIETDVFKILDAYSRSMSKAVAGANIVRILQQDAVLHGKNAFGVIIKEGEMNRILRIDGKSWKMKDYVRQKLGYETSNHPALRDKLVHPLMRNALDDFFAPELQTEGLLNKTIIVNNALKRLAVSFSFFHAQALVLSGAYSGFLGEFATAAGRARLKEIRKVLRGEWVSYGKDKFGKPITKKNIHGEEVTGEIYGIDKVKELADAGVGLGMKANEFVDAGYNTVKALMDKHAPPLSKIQGSIDKWTWDKTHDISKAFAYFTMKQRMMSTTPRGIGKIMPFISRMRGKDLGKWEALSEAEASEIAASFVNDAFGGQRHAKLAMEWQKKAIENANNPKGQMYQWLALWTTPSKAKLSNLALFSPDWTVSNLRIGFRGMGMTKDLFGKIAKGEKFTPREMAEWNLYMGYWVRALASTSALAYILHSFMTDEDDEEFDFNEFWYTGRLNIGAGEEIVVSKQIAEPLHWLANPMHTFLNKTAAAPKIGLEAVMGREWVSMKHSDDERLFFRGGQVTGRYLDKGDPKQMAWWAGNKFTPISFNKITRAIRQGEDWKEEVVPSMFGGVGFPTYQRPLEK